MKISATEHIRELATRIRENIRRSEKLRNERKAIDGVLSETDRETLGFKDELADLLRNKGELLVTISLGEEEVLRVEIYANTAAMNVEKVI